jgi:polyphosphate kinase
MDRNFFRRIETGFPILNPKLKKRVITEGLKPYLRDNVQAWDMQPDGSYRRRKPRRAKPYRAQDVLLELFSR